MTYTRILSALTAAAGFIAAVPTMAQTVTGTIDSTITLTSACEVNGSTGTTAVDFGTLDFGSHTSLFTEATAQVDGNGSGAIAIQCTPGSGATLTFLAGLNDDEVAGSTRAMTNGTLFVPYDIYSDPAFATVLDNGSTVPVTADGTVQIVNVYGRALGNAGLTAGTYTDTIAVTLTF